MQHGLDTIRKNTTRNIRQSSGVTMGWLLRLMTGGPVARGPPTVPEFLMVNFLMFVFDVMA